MLPTASSIAKRFFFGFANTAAKRGGGGTTMCRFFFFFFEVVVCFFVFLFSSEEEAMRRALESLVVETILAGKGRTFRSTSRRRTHRDAKQKPFLGQTTLTRSIFIQTQTTPNPSSLMFLPGKPVLPTFDDDGNDDGKTTTTTTTKKKTKTKKSSVNFSNAREALERKSPLATRLFQIDGVTGVFFGRDFVTVTKSDEHDWEVLKAEVFAKIMDFYASGEDAVRLSSSESSENDDEEEDEDNPNRDFETDSETKAMIKELLETRIKPAVAEDGGDIAFKKFDEEEGVVYVQLRGACDGCPSSTVTLKSGDREHVDALRARSKRGGAVGRR